VIVDVRVGEDGLDDVAGGNTDAVGLFDNMAEGVTKGAVAKFNEPEGVGVVVDGGAGLQIVFLHDGGGADPLKKSFLNEGTGRMVANFAVASVAGQMFLLVLDVGGGDFGEGVRRSAG
jgi:microcystin degradation protein MlrC